jgi:hypothetical protein
MEQKRPYSVVIYRRYFPSPQENSKISLSRSLKIVFGSMSNTQIHSAIPMPHQSGQIIHSGGTKKREKRNWLKFTLYISLSVFYSQDQAAQK